METCDEMNTIDMLWGVDQTERSIPTLTQDLLEYCKISSQLLHLNPDPAHYV
jgi:hypothetical protein